MARPVSVGISYHDASISLVFDGLDPSFLRSFKTFRPESRDVSIVETVRNSKAVILARGLHISRFREVAWYCNSTGVPWYYYTDDNFWVLAEELPEYAWYRSAEARSIAARGAGVIVVSEPMEQYVRANRIHDNVLRLTIALDRSLGVPRRKRGLALTVAFAGHGLRNGPFAEVVEPALVSLRASLPHRVVARVGNELPLLRAANVPVELLPFDIAFPAFVKRWRAYQPDILVHAPAVTANVLYKTPNAVLVAYLLGAVPVLADEPAYEGLSEAQGAYVVKSRDPEAWREMLTVLSDKTVRDQAYERLKQYCTKAFDPAFNEGVLRSLLR